MLHTVPIAVTIRLLFVVVYYYLSVIRCITHHLKIQGKVVLSSRYQETYKFRNSILACLEELWLWNLLLLVRSVLLSVSKRECARIFYSRSYFEQAVRQSLTIKLEISTNSNISQLYKPHRQSVLLMYETPSLVNVFYNNSTAVQIDKRSKHFTGF